MIKGAQLADLGQTFWKVLMGKKRKHLLSNQCLNIKYRFQLKQFYKLKPTVLY